MRSIALAYAFDDQPVAQQIAEDIASHVNVDFYGVEAGTGQSTLASTLGEYDGTLVVLVSEHFLQDENCLFRVGTALLGRQNVLFVYVETQRYDETREEIISVGVDLTDLASQDKFITYWNTKHQSLLELTENVNVEQNDAFRRYIDRVGDVREQIAAVLPRLAAIPRTDLAALERNDYAVLFGVLAAPDVHRDFGEGRNALLANIPGVGLIGSQSGLEKTGAAAGAELFRETGPIEDREEEQNTTRLELIDDLVRETESWDETELAPPTKANQSTVQDKLDTEVVDADAEAAAWITRAWSLYDEGAAETGLELLAGGKEALPDHPDLAYNYALMLALDTEVPEVALLEIHKLLDEFHDHAAALFLSGELSVLAGDYDGANLDWIQLSEVDPLYPDLNYRLGTLISERFPARAGEALTYLRRASRDEPANGDARYRYAMLLHKHLGRDKKAIKWLKRAVDVSPDHAAAYYALAVLTHGKGKLAAARNFYRTAIHLEPAYATDTNKAAFAQIMQAKADTSAREEKALRRMQARIEELQTALASRNNPAVVSPTEPANQPVSNPKNPAPATAQTALDTSKPTQKPGKGKIAFISGATSGIGRATAYALAADGYDMILLARREERLQSLRKEFIANFGIDCLTIAADVRDRATVKSAIANLPDPWKKIDILLNNAGKAKGFDPIDRGDYDHWDEMIDVNLKGLLTLTREISPLMVARKTGTIVNVCSTAGKEVYPKGNVYCATKHAVDALTYAMRLDLVEHGIRVGQICPAHVEETEFAVVRFDGNEERAQIYEGYQPLRSCDVAEAVRFMLNQPAHVNIMDVVLQGTQQASSTVVDRSGREKFAPRD
ncbi:SDR family NAD(P)-dependent oxidoreductase [Neolewinella antarctica]|uniref:NADP-dependent 3-hydroxy acid dehydrogenase YdfG/Flp pilus assembly protein TadD n=1 Tax=Neolewinella antarctica TaxID=442734 RepID=A0ABX0X6N6_9BACT|nr:SDR family NAD(P)-dependent oxidoreductase [Neolewinella antarctica]NJC24725.1 NADP-dependent 3-hydroxy acid dehydrogenase YdfG/Flp pilus assembly protein TadD [Neolewinella antarctica]